MRSLIRSLHRHVPSSVAAIVMAAVGIGVLTIALALVDAALWRPLPFPGAKDLVVVTTSQRSADGDRDGVGWSFPRLSFVRERLTTLQEASPWRPGSLTLEQPESTRRIGGEIVSAEYFALVGVAPRVGRGFLPDEDTPGAPVPVIVVSSALAEGLAASGSPVAVGSTLRFNGQTLTVIGIIAPGFHGLTGSADFWLPTPMAPALTYPQYLSTNQDFITMLARRRADASPDAAAREVGALATAAYAVQPPAQGDEAMVVTGAVTPFPKARIRSEGARASVLVMGGALLLFLLTVANLIALAIGRAVARRRESAVTLAIGATPGRLWRQQAMDSAALSIVGAIAALVTVTLLLQLNGPVDPMAHLGRSFFATWSALSVSWRLVAVWSVVSVLTVLLAAVIPALWTSRRISLDDLREGSHGSISGGTSLRRPGIGAALLGVEAMLAVVLIGAAAQLLESYRRMQREPLGVNPSGVLTFEVQPSETLVDQAQAPRFVEGVLEAVRAVPGVISASVDGGAPLAGSASTQLHIIGRADDRGGSLPVVLRHYVGEEHFSTLGIPLKAGRTFTAADREGAPRVVIISESAARQFFPNGDAIGQSVWFTGSTMTSPDSSGIIIGIVGDVKYTPLLAERTTASFYTPYRQFTYGWRTYFVRVAGDPGIMERAIADAVQRQTQGLPLLNVRPLSDIITSSFSVPQRTASGTGWLALIGLLLAGGGIWAIVSHATAMRRREVAIRIAHGATLSKVLTQLLIEGLTWPFIGLMAGLIVGIAGSGVLRALLYGIAPGDPVTLFISALICAATAALACLFPAMRSARTDPIEALRAD